MNFFRETLLFGMVVISTGGFCSDVKAKDIFTRAKNRCVDAGYSVGTDQYGSCIQDQLRRSRLIDPEQASVDQMKKTLDSQSGKFISDAIAATVIGTGVAVGTAAVVNGIASGLTPPPSPNTGGNVEFGYPIKPYYGQSSPNVVNPPGQFYVPIN